MFLITLRLILKYSGRITKVHGFSRIDNLDNGDSKSWTHLSHGWRHLNTISIGKGTGDLAIVSLGDFSVIPKYY